MNSKDAYYFSHDANARNDLKIVSMIAQYGIEGYGRYWILIEILRENQGFTIMHKQINALALQMQCSIEQAEKFINDCINVHELFKSDGKIFWSESLKKRMNIRNEIIQKRRQAAGIRWSHAKAMQKQYKSNAIKERKGKESKRNKEEKNKEKKKYFIPPTLLECRAYFIEKKFDNALFESEKFFNFYESKNWFVGKNKMVNWHAAAAGWNARNSQKQKGKYTRSYEQSEPELTREQKIKVVQQHLMKFQEIGAVNEIKTCEAQLKKLQEGNE